MKSCFVALSHFSAACSLILAACGAENEKLFDPVDVPAEAEAPPAPIMPEPMAPAAMEPSEMGEQPGPAPNSPAETPDDELPLSGNGDDDVGEGEDDDDEDGGEISEEPPVVPEIVLPEVIAVNPQDGATAVSGDTPIVITFNVPMNQEATEAAYQSERIPSSGVSFSWNEEGTELTILPNQPLAYDSGTDPATVQARRYSFFISSSAEDLEGNKLPAPAEFSFSVLREVSATFLAVRDRDLTGSFLSNGTYGAGLCARNATNTCVGDARVSGDNEQYKGFLTFDLSALPSTMARVSEAQLSMQVTDSSGNPFGGLGSLLIEHAAFGAINMQAFTAQPLAELGTFANTGAEGTVIRKDVLPAVEVDAFERGITQFRLTFEDSTDNDRTSDAIVSTWTTHVLEVKYLLP